MYGIERIPDRGVLFVANHTLYGLIDVPFVMAELWQRREISVRGLGDDAHYAIPVWHTLLELPGMVRGTRENVRLLMGEGQNILVFPGGAGEVFKQKGERYQLKWKERLGFARLAIEFSYPIVPLAMVGVEEMFHLLTDDATPSPARCRGPEGVLVDSFHLLFQIEQAQITRIRGFRHAPGTVTRTITPFRRWARVPSISQCRGDSCSRSPRWVRCGWGRARHLRGR